MSQTAVDYIFTGNKLMSDQISTPNKITLLTRSGKIESKTPLNEQSKALLELFNSVSPKKKNTNSRGSGKTREKAKKSPKNSARNTRKGNSDSEAVSRKDEEVAKLVSQSLGHSTPHQKNRSRSPPTAEKFAWSSFQNAPDARALPIPNFIISKSGAIEEHIADKADASINAGSEPVLQTPQRKVAQVGDGKETDKVKLMLNTFSKLRASSFQ